MRSKMLSVIVLVCGVLCMHPVAAEVYPSKPIKFIVPYSAGGPVDALLRAMAPAMSEELKQPVLIENRTGANEIIAADYVAKSKPDGYTFLVATDAALTMNPHLYKKLPYNAQRDLLPVAKLVTVPMAFLVSSRLPVDSLSSFISYAKANPQAIAYGSSGLGGITHVPMTTFEKNVGISMTHAPYRGAGPLIPDLIAGNIQASLLAVSVVEQNVKNGSLKALAVSAPARVKSLPNVPTFTEQGYKDIDAQFFIGLSAPAGTSAEVTERIASLSAKILKNPAFRERYLEPFAYVVSASSPKAFSAQLEKELAVQGSRLKALGITLD